MTESTLRPRTVRSFVVRRGRISKAQQQALRNLEQKYLIRFQSQLIDFNVEFGRSAPVVLEIGFGMGHSLWQMAAQEPQTNFVGIEVHPPGVGSLMNELEQRSIRNVRVIQHDAIDVLYHGIADESLSALQIFFPDPWHKKRHHKRRLIQSDVVSQCARKLSQDGLLHIATDWEPYAQHIALTLQQCALLRNLNATTLYQQQVAKRPITKFEQRGRALGHAVWEFVWQKNSLNEK